MNARCCPCSRRRRRSAATRTVVGERTIVATRTAREGVGGERKEYEDQISWILEVRVRSGRENDFRPLMAEMVAATEANEPGTLSYEWSVSADGGVCHIYERYTDSTAVMTHLTTFRGRFAARFERVLEPVRTVVYGAPSAAVKDALADLNPRYMEPAAGFNR